MPALRSPGRSRTVTATCRQSPGERSEAGAVDLQPRTSGYVVETDCGRPPPNRHNRYSRKTLNRPLCFYVRPSRPSWTFPGPHSAMCHGAPGHEPFFQRFLFDRPGGPTRQVPRYAYGGLSCLLAVASKLSSVCLALTPSRRLRGVDRQKVADIAAWGRTAGPCLGAD